MTATRRQHEIMGRAAWWCVSLLALTVCVSSAGASPETRAQIEKAIDAPTTLALEDTKLSEVLERIAEQAGVRIVIPPEVAGLIPHGGDTVVGQIKIAHAPLRQALIDLFAPLGMSFVVGEKQIDIVPHDALWRLGRPPTWPELDTLTKLREWEPGVNEEALAQLRSRIQFQTATLNSWAALADEIHGVGAGPGDIVLTVACAQLGWSWTLSDELIVVVTAEALVARQLQQLVSLRINHRPLFDALQALGKRVGVVVRAEPSVLASLPLHMQKNFSINVHQRSAEQVLEEICAYTGLAFSIDPDGVLLHWPGGGAAPAGEVQPVHTASSDPYVAKMTRRTEDGQVVEWLIRRSELPEDLREMRKQNLQAMIDALRKSKAEP